jgi:hypothetical protein
VVLEHLHRLAVRYALHELEQAYAQQHDRLDAGPAVVLAVGSFQRRPGLDQQRMYPPGEQAKPVVLGELLAQQIVNAVQRSLKGKLGKAHP